jgi:hypothetical protein
VNNVDNSNNMMHLINYYKTTWIYADSVDLTNYEWIDNNIQTNYLPYDQRHFDGKECCVCQSYGCKKYLQPQRLTIQEELMKYTNYHKRYESGHTVALHSMAFSILMGLSEIYLTGFDFNYRLGYAYNNTNRRTGPDNYFDNNMYGGDILKDIQVIADSAKNIGIKVYNSNKQSTWNNFEYKEIV